MSEKTDFITEESDPELWRELRVAWENDYHPSYVVKGAQHFRVAVHDGVPKFAKTDSNNLYNSVSSTGSGKGI